MRNKPAEEEESGLQLSRSEQKRRVLKVEELAQELINLSEHLIRKLPCDDFLKTEMIMARNLKAGARKRQTKYLAKELRQLDDLSELYIFLEQQKGSQLKEDLKHHELEHLRDAILADAINAFEEIRQTGENLTEWESLALIEAAQKFPLLDIAAIKQAAARFAHTRKPIYKREIFRQIKSAQEQLERAQLRKE